MDAEPAADPIEAELFRVSYHAVVRYVQRILGIRVPCEGVTAQRKRARRHAHAAGLTVREVRRLILTPGVLLAIHGGFPKVATRNFCAEIAQPLGVVVTILPRARHTQRSAMKTDRELRKGHQRAARRWRRRPATIASEAP